MSISSIGNKARVQAPQKSLSSDSVGSLQRHREGLQKQLEAVKFRPKNSQAEQDAAVAQKQALEKQISMVNQKIQKLMQQKNGTDSSANVESVNAQTVKTLDASNLSLVQSLLLPEKEEQIPWNLKDTGRLVDVYA